MALPKIIIDCPIVPVFPRDKCLRFPGGLEICPNVSDLVPNGYAIANSIIAQANAALAPLNPIFTIIEVILSIIDVLKAVPGVVSNPGKIVSALVEVAKKAAKLLKLIPVLSIPATVFDLLNCLVIALEQLQIELEKIVDQTLKITAAKAQAAGNAPLILLITCAETNINFQFLNTKERFGSLARFVNIINSLLELIGLPPLPLVELGDNAEDALAILSPLIDTLKLIRDSIPLAC